MAQTLQNQIINSKSMNGIMALSDGIALMENGSITNLTNVETDTLNTQSLTSNDFTINTNLDLTGDTSKIQFTYGANPNNTVIDRNGIDTTSAYVENFTYTNISNDISIINWNAGVPTYVSNGAYVNTYYGTSGTDISGWVFNSVLSNEYIAGILKGTGNLVYWTTYFPVASNQAFVLNPSDSVIAYMTSKTYNLVKGQYLFSFYTQCANTGANGLIIDASIKDASGNIVEAITGINPVAIYPNWLFSKISVIIPTTANYTIEFRNRAPSYINGAYILITGIELTLLNSIVVQDTTTNETSVISGGQSTLNNLFINKGITVNDGGLTVLGGGINTNTTYGSNNTTINSSLGELVGASSTADNISVGLGSGQALTSGKRNLLLGVSSGNQLTSATDNVIIGYYSTSAITENKNVIIGNRNHIFGSKAVVIGDNTDTYINVGTVGNFSVSIGADGMGTQVYNGFGTERKNEYSVSVGWQSQQFTADYYNTSVGAKALYNMRGSIATGFITRYNTALGFEAGVGNYSTRNRYNNCTFLGALTDSTVNNISGSTAIGYNCKINEDNLIQLGSNGEKIGISGLISQSSIGTNQNEFKKSNFTEILLNGSPLGSGSQNLASVLSFGAQADRTIDMSENNIINVKELKIKKVISGVSNPAILLETNNDDNNAENIVINRYSTTPAVGDNLFAINIYGRDSIGTSIEYCRINAEILDPVNTAPLGAMRFYTRGGTALMSNYEVLTLQNSAITTNRLINATTGILPATISLAITGTTTLTSSSFGGTTYLVSSTVSATINLPSTATRAGAMITIYNLSSHKHTITSTATILGGFGSNATTQVIARGQGYLFVLNSSQWRCIQVFGVPYSYIRYHNTTQTVGTTAVTALFNSVGGDVDNGNTAWNLDTWNGNRLDYNATTGLFTNNTNTPMTIQVECYAVANPTTATRYVGIQPLATRQASNIIWYSGAAGTSGLIYSNWTFYLGIGETFNIQYQASAAGTTFGSATVGANSNRVVITRLS